MFTAIVTGLFLGSTLSLAALIAAAYWLRRKGILRVDITQAPSRDPVYRASLENLSERFDELRCDHDNLMTVLEPYLKNRKE